jgi:protein TonB
MARELFGRYVADTKPDWKRRALMIGSIGVHVIAGAALLIYSIFHVEEIAPPALSLTFFAAPPPPPPPPLGGGKKKQSDTPKPKVEQPKFEKIVTAAKLIQPTEKPPEKKPEPEEDSGDDNAPPGPGVPDGDKDGVEGGVKGGVKGGTPGGTVGGTGSGGGTPGPAPKMVAAFTLIAQQLQHPDPHLPDWFKNQHAGQTVKGTYKVCIRNDGHVMDVQPMQGIPGMDAEIAAQIKGSWVYKPQPVPVCFVSALTFKIN